MDAYSKCPGSKAFAEPKPQAFTCSSCGSEVEIWTDEISRQCPSCGAEVFRTTTEQSCLDWCEKARECVGEEKYRRYIALRDAEKRRAHG